ncbi:PAS-domain containing protein [Qipengyuania sp.]|uniref:hybrid sensor histidine kinase/response regulator n=1 Tax=Qipengyuania sp. TaxID=2004515 RepID=UPI003BABAA3E
MMLLGAAVAAACFYLAGLFWLAAWRDRTARTETTAGGKPDFLSRHAGLIYGLSLAVYCTSWTFFGGVGTAATAGLDYLPIYLGPILVFTVGFGLVRSILAQSKAQHSTSIADFLSARYGKSASVAAMVTIIATMGSLPYMALQLQSVGASLLTLSPELLGQVAADELVLLVAGSMALFAILFGSRRADRAGDNAGMVLTIAVEAVVKLVALIAVAVLALMVISGAQGPAIDPGNVFSTSQINARFVTLTLIAACAALCLPRQFHMSFVEAGGERATPAMQWVFPAYLLVTAIIIIPIVLAGLTALPAGTDPDTIVLALPLAAGNEALALLVFIGGFSASAGMIVVASVALSTMITNDIIAPLAFRRALSGSGDRSQIAERLLMVRRLVIAALLFFAYLFYLGFGALGSLAGLGTLAFAAAAQFAPGLVLGMVSRAGNKAGMLAGLGVGVALWLVLLILPAATEKAPIISIHPDPLVSGVMLSLGANLAAYWIGSSMRQASLVDAAQAAAFVGTPMPGATPRLATNKRVADVRLLLTQFVGREHADRSIAALCGGYSDNQPADQAVIEMAERTISGVIGTPSARMLVGSWSDGDPIPLAEVVAMFDETNRRLSFSAELLQIAIENIDQGVALVDAEMRLVAWNRRYQELFDLPEELVCVGTPIAELIRFNLKRTDLPSDVIEQQVTRRLEHMRAGREHRIESEQSDGRIMRIVGTPTPGGGYTTSYTDITEDRRAEQALEEKVAERTEQLSRANSALSEATRSKTRFLAAASHDLIQPLNAARLFTSALGEEVAGKSDLERLVRDLDGSIVSADRLIRTLLDISKLDAGGIVPRVEPVALDRVLLEIEREFAVQAAAKGLKLRRVSTSAWVKTDRALITSVLRNLVSNAIRYTDTGGLVIGVRRGDPELRVCVVDTGRGIAPEDRDAIFEEFNRGNSTDREGLGLGLAIVRRTTRLLGLHIETTSQPGRGSQFALHMPATHWAKASRKQPSREPVQALGDARVLVVDNDRSALTATSALLDKWGLSAICAASLSQALDLCPDTPEIVIMDFRLDGDERGDTVYAALCRSWGSKVPAILLTAEDSEETKIAARNMGANRLLKPSSPASLRALISTCLVQGSREGSHIDAESATG